MHYKKTYKRPDDEFNAKMATQARLAAFPKLDPNRPQTIRQMQMSGMRCVPITLAPVPRSKVLTEEDLK